MLKICEKRFCCPVNRKLLVLHEQLPTMRFPVNLTEKGLYIHWVLDAAAANAKKLKAYLHQS